MEIRLQRVESWNILIEEPEDILDITRDHDRIIECLKSKGLLGREIHYPSCQRNLKLSRTITKRIDNNFDVNFVVLQTELEKTYFFVKHAWIVFHFQNKELFLLKVNLFYGALKNSCYFRSNESLLVWYLIQLPV